MVRKILQKFGVAEPEPRAEEPKLDCFLEPEPEPKLRIAAPCRLLSISQRLE
jgi:hypothetical protein